MPDDRGHEQDPRLQVVRSVQARGRTSNEPDRAQIGERVMRALEGLQFGSIELVIHDGRIVQIVRTEKVRIEPPR